MKKTENPPRGRRTPKQYAASRPAPAPRGTRARPTGARRALVRPRPVRTVYGRAVMADLARAGSNRTDLAEKIGCSVSRVHQVLRDRRMDDDPGRDAVMDGWRDRIRDAMSKIGCDGAAPAHVRQPVPQPPPEPPPGAQAPADAPPAGREARP